MYSRRKMPSFPLLTSRLGYARCAFLIAVWFATVVQAQLALVGDVKGRPARLERLGVNQLIGRHDEDYVRVPLDACRVEGDLRANARLLYWPSFFFLHHPPTRDGILEAERPWFSYLRLVSGEGWNGAKAETIWAEKLPERAVVIFGWMIDGRIVHQKLIPLPDRAQRHRYRLDHSFQLTDAENRGQPVMLLWADGRFIPVRPEFPDVANQHVMDTMMLGDVAEFCASLTPEFLRRPAAGYLLQRAAMAGNAFAVDALLSRGVPPDAGGTPTALVRAADKGRLPVVERLLAAKADPRRDDGESAILQIALRGGHDQIAERLLEAGAGVKGRGGFHPSPLDQAIEGGHARLARNLIQRGARRARPATTAELMPLVALGRVSSVALLLEQKVDINGMVNRTTPLVAATRTRNLAMVQALLAGGAKADLAEVSGLTPLMVASINGDLSMARMLLDRGATVLALGADRNRSLHYGVMAEGPDMADLLIQHGADVNAPGGSNLRPLEIALLAGREPTVRRLIEHGAIIKLGGQHGPRVLEAAVIFDLVPIVRQAVAAGWKPEAKLPGGATIGALARLAGAVRVEKMLATINSRPWPGTSLEIAPSAELDTPPKAIHTEPPPDTRVQVEGPAAQKVQIELIIDDTGAVVASRPIVCPDGLLASGCIQTMRRWRFLPPTRRSLRPPDPPRKKRGEEWNEKEPVAGEN